ncbi:MAG: efflux RND transporter permease subunit [Firmicutes bacterium]|nr:efflux RND transporter permease subunit [Bacillota bacterium]
MKKLIELCVRRPLGVIMLVLFVSILGFISFSRLKLDLYPNIQFPIIMAFTNYEGAGPEEIENLITKPMESAISSVQNVKEVRSTSSTGSSMVMGECNFGTDMDFTNLKMRERIDMIKKILPEGAEEPMLLKFDPSMMPIIVHGISCPKGIAEATRLTDNKIKNRLERVPGVASVSLMGGLTREIQVLLSTEKLNFYHISPSFIIQTLRGENLNLPGGIVKSGQNEMVLRTIGEFQSVEDLKSIKITLPNGSIIPLQEIAAIRDSYHEQKQYSRINGQNSVMMMLMKESDANTVLVTREVRKAIQELQTELKDQIKFHKLYEQADYIEQSLGNVTQNALFGALLAVLVLYFFLRSYRSTFIVSVAIPISIIITFAAIYFSNMTLNLVSMGGLALGVGMLVDNAIVVLEVIFRYREEGHDALTAATGGTSEVAMAITASTLTSIVIFIPILFVEGIAAQIFKEMAMTVSFSLGASLVVALTVIPMLSSKLMAINTGSKVMRKIDRQENYRLGKMEGFYRKILSWAVGNQKIMLLFAFILFILGLLPFFFGAVKTNFTPFMEDKEYSIDIELPLGTSLETTDELVQKIESHLIAKPESDLVYAMVGAGSGFSMGSSGESEKASLSVVMKAKTIKTLDEMVEEVRRDIGEYPGAKINIAKENHGGFSSGSPITINILGPDLNTLKNLAEQLKEVVKNVPETLDVKSSWEDGRPELQLRVNRPRATAYGISPSTIASTVQAAFQGTVATQIRLAGEEYDVLLQLNEGDRKNETDIKKLYLTTASGGSIPITEVVDFKQTTGPNKINRENQTRRVQVTSQIEGNDLGKITKKIQEQIKQDMVVPPNYDIVFSGNAKEMEEAFGALALALIFAIILVYIVIAIQYENLVHPLAIMGSIPLSLFGVSWSLMLTGRIFDVSAFIGVIMLTGIVVNNAIVLVDYIETLRSRGMDRTEAILEAGPTRLRPVLMTTLTTVLGLVPLGLGIGEGAEMNVSMATVVIGGLTFSTFLTLVIIPIIYSILDDFALWVKRLIKHKAGVSLEYHR